MMIKKIIYNIIFTIFLTIFSTSYSLAQAIEEQSTKPSYIGQVDPLNFTNYATLQSLNKITAKTTILEATVGEEIQFGKLFINIHKCWKAPLHEAPENKMLVEIFHEDLKTKEKERIFFGWIFSSSPSISGLEHPIYDVTALKCINKEKKDEQ